MIVFCVLLRSSIVNWKWWTNQKRRFQTKHFLQLSRETIDSIYGSVYDSCMIMWNEMRQIGKKKLYYYDVMHISNCVNNDCWLNSTLVLLDMQLLAFIWFHTWAEYCIHNLFRAWIAFSVWFQCLLFSFDQSEWERKIMKKYCVWPLQINKTKKIRRSVECS